MVQHEIVWGPGITLDAIEKMVIIKAFAFFKKNKTHTANALGIAIKTLDNKLSRYEHEEKMESERLSHVARRREEDLARHRGNPPNNFGIPFSPNQVSPRLPDTRPGFRMESITNAGEKQTMSLQERQEVQKVSSESPSQSSKERRR